MPPLSNQGTRPLATSTVATTSQTGARPAHAAASPSSGNPAVAQGIFDRESSVRLSAKALTTGAQAEAGKSTLQVASQFMEGLAGAMFGDAAQGARFDFDALRVESAASFAASATSTSAPNGGITSASMALTESAQFVGSGQLTLADGKTYDFEVAVKYEAAARVSSTETTRAAPHEASPDMILTGKQLPPIKYPGGVEDLFKLLGRELSTESGDPGKLTLRLMRLVDRAALLAPRLPADDVPVAAARKFAASAYASAGAAEA